MYLAIDHLFFGRKSIYIIIKFITIFKESVIYVKDIKIIFKSLKEIMKQN